ncbi:MAG: hypothetical protein FWF18_02950 [Dehalococcoidia bacterium]|nr:hypothetical protein [Dehalococcoidia bacterium]
MSLAQVHPGGSVATEGSGGVEQLSTASSGCFVTRKLVPPAWIYVQVHPGGSTATEGSGGVEQLSTASSGCFVTRRLVPPARIYDQVHPGESAATEGSGSVVPVTTPRPLQMLRHSQARSSSMDL